MVEVVRKPLTGNAAKRCSKCDQVKPRFLFNRNNANKDGLESFCKECRKQLHACTAEYQRERYRLKKEEERLRALERQANGEPVKIKQPEKREPLNDSSVVDSARLVLSQNGWTARRLAIADLNEVMTEANRILHGDRKPQLGRNPAWRHE